jgi:hypothetical protein
MEYTFISAEEKEMNICASFYWEYVIMYLEFMFKRTQRINKSVTKIKKYR